MNGKKLNSNVLENHFAHHENLIDSEEKEKEARDEKNAKQQQ